MGIGSRESCPGSAVASQESPQAPVVLGKQDIRRVIDALPEPTKSIITVIVVGSLRIGEIAALRWERIHSDRIDVRQLMCGSNAAPRRHCVLRRDSRGPGIPWRAIGPVPSANNPCDMHGPIYAHIEYVQLIRRLVSACESLFRVCDLHRRDACR